MKRMLPTNPMAAAWLAYTVWRKLPTSQRQLLIVAARTHGPRIAAAAMAAAAARAKKPR